MAFTPKFDPEMYTIRPPIGAPDLGDTCVICGGSYEKTAKNVPVALRSTDVATESADPTPRFTVQCMLVEDVHDDVTHRVSPI